ncbi:hypothetical protein ACFL6I_08385 [candidate division KSB1 bacterium]
MSDLVQKRVKLLKDKLEKLRVEVSQLEKEEQAGLLSPIERMRIASLHEERKELLAKVKELLM